MPGQCKEDKCDKRASFYTLNKKTEIYCKQLRLDLLKETINTCLENIPQKEVTNEFLFYDYNI